MAQPSTSPGGTLHLRPGFRLEHFLVLDDLGGSHRPIGATLHALDVRSGVEVALRVEPMDRGCLEDFLAAYRLARRRVLQEVTLPAMLGAGWSHGIGWVATRWVHGVDARSVMQAGALPPELVATVALHITLALSELHGRGLVHGDVSPHNLRLDTVGKLALVGHLPVPYGASTPALAVSGSRVRFAAPERFPDGAPTAAGDVFSLGLTLWALLWGQDTLPAETREDAPAALAGLRDQLTGSPRFEALPEDLRLVLDLCLEPDPGWRPASATQLLGHLEGALRLRAEQAEWAASRLAREVQLVAAQQRPAGLASVRKGLAAGEALAAASRLQRCVVVAPPVRGSPEHVTACELQREVLWETFRATPEEDAEGTGRKVASCVLARRIAEALEAPVLASMARRRAGALDPEGSPPEDPESSRAALRELLRKKPGDPVAPLLVALVTPGVEWEPEEPAPAFRARLLSELGAHQAALVQLARELGTSPLRPGLAAEVAALADRLAVVAGEARPEPPRNAGIAEEAEEDQAAAVEEAELPEVVEVAEVAAAAPDEADEADVAVPTLEELAGADVPVARVPVMGHEELEEADVEFTRGQILVREGRLGEAAGVFRELLARGALHQEHFYAAICGELRALMWQALCLRDDTEDHLEAIRVLWDLTLDLELESMLPLASRLWLGALQPGDGRLAKIEELLERCPRSVLLRQAAAQEARSRGLEDAWARHLVEAGFLFLERMDLEGASRMFMAARPILGGGRVDEGLKQVLQAGTRVAEAAARLRELEAVLDEEAVSAAEAFRLVQEFLAEFPYYRPAAERIVELAQEDGRPLPASLAHMRLALDAFLRGREREATGHLRDILSIEYGNDEALLYLASLDWPESEAPTEVPLLRIWLLRHHGLLEAARYRARRELRYADEDRPYLQILAELSEELGEDPTAYLVELGLLDLRAGDVDHARGALREALEVAPDRGLVVRQLLEVPEIWTVFRPADLLSEPSEEE